MSLRDLFIIYLACGAPLGVYYFLQNRNALKTKALFFKSLVRFVFWIPFAFQIVARTSLLTKLYNNGFDPAAESDAKKEHAIEEIRKSFENSFTPIGSTFSIFEFREIFERYVGLSLEANVENADISPAETEIFRITNHSNKKLAEICLNRRNRRRLSFHQKLARRDFFEMFDKFIAQSADRQPLFQAISNLTKLLGDGEAQKMTAQLAKDFLQTEASPNVKNTGKEIWSTDQHKPLNDSRIATNLQVLTATANSSNKD